jgi:hypothetical protein
MKISELLIIYFSIGAPVAVRVYFQKRAEPRPNEKKARLAAFLTFLFWLPAVVLFFGEQEFTRKFFRSETKSKKSAISVRAENLDALQKQLEKIACGSGLDVSLFELRETLARYVGLTIAAQSAEANDGEIKAHADFFRAGGHDAPERAAKCFSRRNRERIFFHQRRAQTDFLNFCKNVFSAAAHSDAEEFFSTASQFVKILRDEAAGGALEKTFAEQNSPEKRFLEKSLENDLWKPRTHEPPSSTAVKSISTVSPLISAKGAMTTNLRKKD